MITLDQCPIGVPAPAILHDRPAQRPVVPLPVPSALQRALAPLDRWGARIDADAVIRAAGDTEALQHAVRVLAAELNRLRGVGLEAQIGCELIELPWCDGRTIVEFEFEDGADATEATLLGVLINGDMVDAESVATAEQLTEWREAIGQDFKRRNDEARADEDMAYGEVCRG